MIVTFPAAARSRAARRSPRSISRGVARATFRGPPCCLRLTPYPPATQSSRYQASVRTVNGADHPDLVTTSHLPGGQPGVLARLGKEKDERTGGDCGRRRR